MADAESIGTVRIPEAHHHAMTSLKQVGALPVRKTRKGALEVLLVSSRDTGRWVIPKGWPAKRMTDSAAIPKDRGRPHTSYRGHGLPASGKKEKKR